MEQDELSEIIQSFPEDRELCQSYLKGLVGDIQSRRSAVGSLICSYKKEKLAYLVCKQFAEFGKGGYEHWMGLMCEKGIGTDRDERCAAEWYWLGAAIGDPECQYDLGYVGIMGTSGNAVSWEEGFRMMSASAEAGFPRALSFMGMMFAVGIGVKKDPEKAFGYYSKAADAGLLEGKENLAYCYETGFGVRQDIRRAMRLYETLPDPEKNLRDCRRALDEQMHMYM